MVDIFMKKIQSIPEIFFETFCVKALDDINLSMNSKCETRIQIMHCS